jgi:uracil-DNA glycosylase family 4
MLTKYKAHKNKWSTCKKCDLHKTRCKVVVQTRCTKLPCDVLFVGEAPGIGEDTTGKPFVGKGGGLLDEIIEKAMGENKFHIAFTNLVSCIPLEDDGSKTIDPSLKFIKACKPKLKEIIEISKVQTIVSVGKLAKKHVKITLEEMKTGEYINTINITHPVKILSANKARQGLMIQRCVVMLEDMFEKLVPF